VQVHVPLQFGGDDGPHARAGLPVAVPGGGGVHGDGQVQRGEDGGDLALEFGQVRGVLVRRLEARLVAEDRDVVAGPMQGQQPGGDVRGPERPVASRPRVDGAREGFYERSILHLPPVSTSFSLSFRQRSCGPTKSKPATFVGPVCSTSFAVPPGERYRPTSSVPPVTRQVVGSGAFWLVGLKKFAIALSLTL
jgi:hypothetical protein